MSLVVEVSEFLPDILTASNHFCNLVPGKMIFSVHWWSSTDRTFSGVKHSIRYSSGDFAQCFLISPDRSHKRTSVQLSPFSMLYVILAAACCLLLYGRHPIINRIFHVFTVLAILNLVDNYCHMFMAQLLLIYLSLF